MEGGGEGRKWERRGNQRSGNLDFQGILLWGDSVSAGVCGVCGVCVVCVWCVCGVCLHAHMTEIQRETVVAAQENMKQRNIQGQRKRQCIINSRRSVTLFGAGRERPV